MFFEAGRFEPNPDHSAAWNRGAYLVQGLTHCGSCHTPRNALYASEKDHALTGGEIPGQGWYAVDISTGPESRIADWTVPELVTYMRTGVKDGEAAVGPMREVIKDSLSEIDRSDPEAIAIYLKDSGVPSAAPAPRKFQALPQSAFQSGMAIYEASCSGCHGSDGGGMTGAAPSLRNTVEAAEPSNAIAVVLRGVEVRETYPRMASFADAFDNEPDCQCAGIRVLHAPAA
jgi:mono/diheme cytochrome c family protein